MTDWRIFRYRVKRLCLLRGMKQQDLHKSAGVSGSNFYRIMSGQVQNPYYKTLENIAEVLDTSVDYLVGKTDLIEGRKNENS